MRWTHRAAAMLTLSLALVSATTAVAAATPPPTTGVEDQNDRLLRNLQAGQAERTQAAVERYRSMERHFNATAAFPSPAAIENRLLRSLKAERAERTQAAVALARSMERNLTPVPAAAVAATQPAAQPAAARGVDVLATLLLGLVGGLVGGGAAIGGWTVVNRRRLHRAAAAT